MQWSGSACVLQSAIVALAPLWERLGDVISASTAVRNPRSQAVFKFLEEIASRRLVVLPSLTDPPSDRELALVFLDAEDKRWTIEFRELLNSSPGSASLGSVKYEPNKPCISDWNLFSQLFQTEHCHRSEVGAAAGSDQPAEHLTSPWPLSLTKQMYFQCVNPACLRGQVHSKPSFASFPHYNSFTFPYLPSATKKLIGEPALPSTQEVVDMSCVGFGYNPMASGSSDAPSESDAAAALLPRPRWKCCNPECQSLSLPTALANPPQLLFMDFGMGKSCGSVNYLVRVPCLDPEFKSDELHVAGRAASITTRTYCLTTLFYTIGEGQAAHTIAEFYDHRAGGEGAWYFYDGLANRGMVRRVGSTPSFCMWLRDSETGEWTSNRDIDLAAHISVIMYELVPLELL